MQSFYPILQATPLFGGFTTEELTALLNGLGAVQKRFAKGETLLLAGEGTRNIGVVLKGEIRAAKETREGGAFTVSRMGPGGVYGDVLSGAGSQSPVSVTTPTGCLVLLVPYLQLFAPTNNDPLYRRMLANLVGVVADKYFALDKRIDLLLVKGLRKRIAAYLLAEAARANSSTFAIPYTRTALAQYLGCERSALSRELSRMQADGLLETYRQSFRLLDAAALQALP